MDLPRETIETTIKVYLSQMRARLDDAANYGLRPHDGKGVARVRKQSADPAQHPPVRATNCNWVRLPRRRTTIRCRRRQDFCL